MGNQKFTPFAQRFVGFEEIFKELEDTLSPKTNKYPPYNLSSDLDETLFVIELAVAGFTKADLSVTLTNNVLTIEGEKPEQQTGLREIHRGISQKKFTRTFTLAEHIEVSNVSLDNGILVVELLKNIPEEKTAKHFKID